MVLNFLILLYGHINAAHQSYLVIIAWLLCVSIGSLPVVGGDDSTISRDHEMDQVHSGRCLVALRYAVADAGRARGWRIARMNGWMDGWMNGCMDGWMDGWM